MRAELVDEFTDARRLECRFDVVEKVGGQIGVETRVRDGARNGLEGWRVACMIRSSVCPLARESDAQATLFCNASARRDTKREQKKGFCFV